MMDKELTLTPLREKEQQLSFEREISSKEGFSDLLILKGLIDAAFVEEGALDVFGYSSHDDHGEIWSLKHILVGDTYANTNEQGLHHLRTVMDIGLCGPDRTIASRVKVVEDKKGPKIRARDVSQQRIRDNGCYLLRGVELVHPDTKRREAKNISWMFPDEWSTQRVIENMLRAYHDPDHIEKVEATARYTTSRTHYKMVDDVIIKLIVDEATGLIKTGYPQDKLPAGAEFTEEI